MTVKVRSGGFRERVLIQELKDVQNTFGEVEEESAGEPWQDLVKRWANVQREHGSSDTSRSGDRSVAMYLVEIRAEQKLEITPDSHRLIWEGKVLNITSPVDVESRRRVIQIRAESYA